MKKNFFTLIEKILFVPIYKKKKYFLTVKFYYFNALQHA
jgi:hypothetical protein